ncbi:hypothetical protein PCASD_16652 [Puccinia coronata f. sp. avenae]|uniref:Uncharacterized protein n=1 Tax=Puccinia coronata f. sp. avenae TaxID=200324 RepID=A0A2N5SBE0_9BASI|nr:hypothetical protein PCASD_16652 [Puccinia coronata f. sp. avenae]
MTQRQEPWNPFEDHTSYHNPSKCIRIYPTELMIKIRTNSNCIHCILPNLNLPARQMMFNGNDARIWTVINLNSRTITSSLGVYLQDSLRESILQ